MKSFSKFDCILWDFDGVLMDSMPVRDTGFAKVLCQYPPWEVEELLKYHRSNGGLSRYVKFRYFFEVIRNEPVTDEKVLQLAEEFSAIMMELLLNPKLLIQDSLDFVRNNYMSLDMHIISGSDGTELKKICNLIGISNYFKSIQGSPTPKTDLVNKTVAQYPSKKVILIGDSLNDFHAAQENAIQFAGYNNIALKELSPLYIERFAMLEHENKTIKQSYGP